MWACECVGGGGSRQRRRRLARTRRQALTHARACAAQACKAAPAAPRTPAHCHAHLPSEHLGLCEPNRAGRGVEAARAALACVRSKGAAQRKGRVSGTAQPARMWAVVHSPHATATANTHPVHECIEGTGARQQARQRGGGGNTTVSAATRRGSRWRRAAGMIMPCTAACELTSAPRQPSCTATRPIQAPQHAATAPLTMPTWMWSGVSAATSADPQMAPTICDQSGSSTGHGCSAPRPARLISACGNSGARFGCGAQTHTLPQQACCTLGRWPQPLLVGLAPPPNNPSPTHLQADVQDAVQQRVEGAEQRAEGHRLRTRGRQRQQAGRPRLQRGWASERGSRACNKPATQAPHTSQTHADTWRMPAAAGPAVTRRVDVPARDVCSHENDRGERKSVDKGPAAAARQQASGRVQRVRRLTGCRCMVSARCQVRAPRASGALTPGSCRPRPCPGR
jgi:hypothetical protein